MHYSADDNIVDMRACELKQATPRDGRGTRPDRFKSRGELMRAGHNRVGKCDETPCMSHDKTSRF